MKRTSTNYVGTFDPLNKKDQANIAAVREAVKVINKNSKNWKANRNKLRVELRGRKPFTKKNGLSYNWGGNIVGGIKNASKVDLYIYDRYA
tara:strand:+ start:380 stop:652 length:273 start_codon:yes stop_codon:yes gene_type:complete